jgi:flagellar motility protein MotE (MotC chaperone)
MWKIPPPRLLPGTIAVLASLLALKSGGIVEAVVMRGGKPDTAMVGAANAASTERSSRPPTSGPPDQTKPAVGSAPPTAGQKPLASPPAAEDPPPVSEIERTLLQNLRQRRKELDARAAALTARESLIMAAEQKLGARVIELQTLQKKLEGLDTAQKQKEEAGWQGLVKVYEAMKPKEAAVIFNDLQMPVLLQVFNRMKDAKTAAVMAAMNPDKARDVTAELAQMRMGKNGIPPAPPLGATGG